MYICDSSPTGPDVGVATVFCNISKNDCTKCRKVIVTVPNSRKVGALI